MRGFLPPPGPRVACYLLKRDSRYLNVCRPVCNHIDAGLCATARESVSSSNSASCAGIPGPGCRSAKLISVAISFSRWRAASSKALAVAAYG